MGAKMLVLQMLMLVLCSALATASTLPHDFVGNYVDADIQRSDKKMEAMDYRLDQVNEDYKVLKNELSRTTNLVEELKNEVMSLKTIVMVSDGQQGSMLLDYVMDAEPQPSMRDVVEEYNRTTNWYALRQGLEKSLEKKSVEYQQLEDINDHSWGHLWQVGYHGYEELATLLMDAGLPANKTDEEGESMLHGAAEGGMMQLAQVLLDRGQDVNQRGWRGLTPVNKAALGGKPEMTKWLADRGADVSSADDNGMTSLHFAAEHGHLDVVRLLVVEMGLATGTKDVDGWTPYDWARRKGQSAVAEFLSTYPH